MRRWLAVASLLGVCSCFAAPGVGATADLEAVKRALGTSGTVSLSPTPAASARLVEVIAKQETVQLGRGDREWKPSNPRWAGVYAQVRADLEAEAPELSAELAAATQRFSDHLADAVAAEMSESDVAAILAYYDTEQGKRYVALMSRLDSLLAGGLADAMPPTDLAAKAAPAPLAEDRQTRLLEFMTLSRTMQAASAAQQVGTAMHADTSGLGGVAFLMALSLRFHQEEVVALYTQYEPDIPAFTEFEKTPAAQNLFRAFGRVMFLSKQPPPVPVIEVISRVEERHQKAWQELYRQSAP